MGPKHVGFVLAVALILAFCHAAPGKVFVLTNGGRVVGELLNPEQSPREKYVIKTSSGGQITLAKSQVKEILDQRPEVVEYEKTRSSYPDTAEGQWALAEWCREHRLLSQRKTHLERIIELHPDHAKARRGLGYHQKDGRWVTKEEEMARQGYRLYKGRYRSPQAIQLLEEKRKREAAEQDWARKLKQWRKWLGDDKSQLARANILAIKDPMAVGALVRAMKDDPREPARILFVESLARIGTPEALMVLADRSLNDPIEEVRLTCLDFLKESKSPEVVAYLARQLQNKTNRIVNRAAIGLGQMKDPSAIRPLIQALWTTHKLKVVSGNAGQLSPTFNTGGGGGGGGLTVGGGPRILKRTIRNQTVLDALVGLTGVHFGFNVNEWSAWYASQKKTVNLDARRN